MHRRHLIGLAAAAALAPAARAESVMGPDGLYTNPMFRDTFLDMAEDHAEAAAEGKTLAVLFEQNGCPYCREMHEVNLKRPEIAAYLDQHFFVVQLDLWGARPVTDFDGAEAEERALAAKWYVNFTPTMLFFGPDKQGAGSFQEAESFRLPGYFKPFHFLSALEYVATGETAKQPFQRYLQDKFAALAAQGIDPEVW